MAEKRQMSNVSNRDEAVLWLWAAHNQVNRRLAGDSTEDPDFPKIQFPSMASCPSCHLNISQSSAHTISTGKDDLMQEPVDWSRTHVLQFLKNIYHPEYLNRFGLQSTTGNAESLRARRMTGNVFSEIDIRMGILLYGFCILMLVVAFKLFVTKGTYRRRMFFARDVVGKV